MTYPQPYGAYPPVAPPTNTMAVLALVGSVLGLTALPLIGSLVGVILGHVARKQIAQTGEGGSGMAVAALVVGYAGLAIMVLTLVLVVFVFGSLGAGFLLYGS